MNACAIISLIEDVLKGFKVVRGCLEVDPMKQVVRVVGSSLYNARVRPWKKIGARLVG